MKILLIQPPIQDFYQTSIRTQPIGLAYLASSIISHGFEVEILDCQTEKRKSIPIAPELSYLKDLYPFDDQSPFKLYTGYYHFGMDWKEIRQKIEESKADVFGISSSFTPYSEEALRVARIIKDWDRRKIVVMGGAHVSGNPEEVLKNPCIDYVIFGEGEIRFPLLLKQIRKGTIEQIEKIDGIGFRWNNEIKINPHHHYIQDLDLLPIPARDLLDLNRYRIKRKRSTMIVTSRGCPHGCAYCSAHLVMGSSFRTRSLESIAEEMAECHDKYGISLFDIEDDNFTYDQNRAKRLMNLIVETFKEKDIELTAMNGISFASLDGELLRLMKRAGFKTINLSFVSTDPFLKASLGRPEGSTHYEKVLKDAEETGLHVITYAILGMPGQTIEEMVNTLIYLMEKRVLIGPSIYYPTPGTPLFKRCKKEGLLPPYPSQWRSSAFPIETKEFNCVDLSTLFRLTRMINFIKSKMDEGELNEGMTWEELFRMMKGKGKVESFTSKKQENVISWNDLLIKIIDQKSFWGLRKSPLGDISIIKVRTSNRVLDYFFEKAWKRPIAKSRNG